MNAEPPTLAIIGHLESFEAYRSALEASRGAGLPPLELEAVRLGLRHTPPMPLCTLVLRSPRGTVREARYIDLGLVVEPGWTVDRSALARVREACAEAGSWGARLGTLGGFSSIVGESARANLSEEYGLPFTTGNTLTAATIAEQAVSLDRNANARVTVVGAAGDVGSGVCRLLHSRGARLTLVGRSVRPIEALAAELPGARILTWNEAAAVTDIAILVASAGFGEIQLDALPPGAIVLDGGHPPNARGAARVRYARAGRVAYDTPPECDLPVIFSDRYPPGQTHACVGEGIVLALEGTFAAYSVGRGRIVAARAAEILRLARRHGVGPAPVRFEAAAV